MTQRTDVMIPPGHPIDRRIVAAVALLNSAIERQDNDSLLY
jgi:hypothetical protein